MSSRFTACVAASLVMLSMAGARSAGTDITVHARTVASSSDVRMRADACLMLGSSGDLKARRPLEGALDDPHPTVRQAAASGLAKLGDVLAVAALESRLAHEPNRPTQLAILSTLDTLRRAPAPSAAAAVASGEPVPPNWSQVKYVVYLERVANQTTVRGVALTNLLEGVTRSKFGSLPGVYVLPSVGGESIVKQARKRGLPVLEMAAQVVSLDQAVFAGDLKVQAKVSFSISRSHVIKSAIEGNASSIGSVGAAKNPSSLGKLQDMAVDGAVVSAISKAPTAIQAAAR